MVGRLSKEKEAQTCERTQRLGLDELLVLHEPLEAQLELGLQATLGDVRILAGDVLGHGDGAALLLLTLADGVEGFHDHLGIITSTEIRNWRKGGRATHKGWKDMSDTRIRRKWAHLFIGRVGGAFLAGLGGLGGGLARHVVGWEVSLSKESWRVCLERRQVCE